MGSPPVCIFGSAAIFHLLSASGKRASSAALSQSRCRDGAPHAKIENRLETDTELQHFATISGE
jgi:hypothetical protein